MISLSICTGWHSPFSGNLRVFSILSFIVPWELLVHYLPLAYVRYFSVSSVSWLLLSTYSFSCSSCVASLFVVLSASLLLFLFSMFELSSDEMRSITSSVCLTLFLGLIASRKFIHAWYSGVLSVKPISWMSDLRLGFVGDFLWSGGESMLNFTGDVGE